MKTSPSKTLPEDCAYYPGDLVYVAGEMLVHHSELGRMTTTMFAIAQMGLVLESRICPYSSKPYLLVWFAEFGLNKEREHVLVRAPLGRATTKVWCVPT